MKQIYWIRGSLLCLLVLQKRSCKQRTAEHVSRFSLQHEEGPGTQGSKAQNQMGNRVPCSVLESLGQWRRKMGEMCALITFCCWKWQGFTYFEARKKIYCLHEKCKWPESTWEVVWCHSLRAVCSFSGSRPCSLQDNQPHNPQQLHMLKQRFGMQNI